MVVVAISDIHGRTEAVDKVSDVLSTADLVLITGDITHFGRTEDAREVINRVRRFSKRLYAILGNCDYSEVGSFLSMEGVSLDERCILIEDYAFMGIGGSLPCPGKTPNEYTEDDFAERLSVLKNEVPSDKPCILVSHQPPFDTRCDRTRSGEHVGSRALRSFIIDVEPLLCVSGHIHEARGVDAVDITKVANPGPLFNGGYTCVELEREKLTVRIY